MVKREITPKLRVESDQVFFDLETLSVMHSHRTSSSLMTAKYVSTTRNANMMNGSRVPSPIMIGG